MRASQKIVAVIVPTTASSFAPYSAPAGYYWAFVTDPTNSGQRVTDQTAGNQSVVVLAGK